MKIAIVGAGITGRMLAWQMLQAGLRPVIFDKESCREGSAASYTAAGMLAPYAELTDADDFIFRLGMKSLPLWAKLAAQLQQDIGYRTTGTLVVSHVQDRAELQHYRKQLHHHVGEPAASSWRELNGEELGRLEPIIIERFKNALYLPEEAKVNNLAVMEALHEDLQEAGVEINADCQVEIQPGGVLSWQGGQRRFELVVDCRGLGARDVLPTLRGVRGELIEVQAEDVAIHHMLRLMHPRYRLYLAPSGNGRYLLGATQIESEDGKPLSVRSALELLSALFSLHSGFAEASILGSRVNLRPALPDHKPVVSYSQGVLRINGLFRHGFLLSPLLSAYVLDWLRGGTLAREDFPALFSEERLAL